jgi:uncharacterized protein
MLRIYNYMASGLALTGIVALVFAQSGLYASLARTPLIWLVMLAPLGLVMWLSYGIQRMQASTAQALYWIYAALMGVSAQSSTMRYRYSPFPTMIGTHDSQADVLKQQ